ncbi:alpha/beta hydrolase [Corynebacterium lubricantis]|uniref:alpha/beta hydrolase n=1 Tax=Corynebacterium lubricantis TaxID=541095 RepID=UPI00039B58F4|nr:alpha/beta hydrolase family protein [Corynebacterium lubricantis]
MRITGKSILAAVVSLVLAGTIAAYPVNAQESSSSNGSSIPSAGDLNDSQLENVLRAWTLASSERPGSSGASIDVLLSSLGLIGSSNFAIPAEFQEVPGNYPYPVDETITQVELISRVDSPAAGLGVERWTVASPSMGRNILVDVRPQTTEAGPIVTLLDGINAPVRSGWLYGPGHEDLKRVFADEAATLVFPLDANGTWYSDWESDDEVLGRQKWETFIVEELLPLIEAQSDISFNGNHAIGGLSMGATGAVHLANANPDVFDATFGISGCYSTMSPVGSQISRLVPEARGAKAENMWGPQGSEEWVRHDVPGDPSGLLTMPVYLSSADGSVDPERDIDAVETATLAIGSVLERGVLTCTRELDRALSCEGATNHMVHYKGHGLHDWQNFREELEPAWEFIRPALY